jgi:hypothetical protein
LKKLKVETDVATASYDLTLFFTDEVNQLSGNDLSVIKVNGNAIDDASSSANNFQISTPETMHTLSTNTHIKARIYWTWNICFNGTRDFVYTKCIADEFKIYPVLSADKAINIISNKTAIDHVDIYAINGALMSSLELESRNKAQIAVSKLTRNVFPCHK